MKNKLLIVTPYYYPKIGGLENYAYKISLALKKLFKWDIIVITSNHVDRKDKIEIIDGLKIYRLGILLKISNTPVNPFWLWKIKKIILNEKPNIINVHTPVPFIADITTIAAGNIPVIVTYHALNLYKYNFTFFNFIIWVYKFFEYYLFKKATKIIIVSDIIKTLIPDKFRHKVITINNALLSQDIPRYKKYRNKNQTNIVFISNLNKSHEWKGLNEILQSIKYYKNNFNNDIKLFVIGEGNYKHKYKQLVNKYKLSDNVIFFGSKQDKEKIDILKKSTMAVIYPKSSNDAFPTVALEYWANSIPIIASDIEPINKIFRNKITALLVKPKNPEALAKSIKYLANNFKFNYKLSQNGYLELDTKYRMENEIKKLHLFMKGYCI